MVENEELVLGQDVVLKEKETLKELLYLLPQKAQLGFTGLKDKWSKNRSLKKIISVSRSNDALKVQYTCLDVSNKSIAIGCNLGIVFLYTRQEKKLSRLICESKQIPIVSIKLLEEKSLIATGQFSGSVTIFKYEDDKNGQVKASLKCTVESHHTAPVTSLQWTMDGTKLFTSDSEGNVAITVINMDESISHTVFICKEDSPVTQLSFCHTALLISTLKRTLVWPFNTKKIVQVGQQERKLIGNFGACFFPPCSPIPSDDLVCIYAARPGLRLWCASIEGKVCSTMIFKDSIYKEEPQISTIELPSHNDSLVQSDQKQFGKLLVFSNRFLVSWQGSCLWVIDPSTGCVIGCHSNLGFIVDVALTGNELYVLSKGETNFIRQIIFETVVSVPCIVTEVLDLNEPRYFEKVQRSSSINHFEDQDKLEKIFDEVGAKVKVAISDVKWKVKEIKEQMIFREESEDDRASDSDKFQSTIKVSMSSPHSNISPFVTSEEKSSSDKSNESDSTENERSTEPFGSSYEDEKNVNPQLEKSKVFEHLSQKEFPSDIVFEGTSKGTTLKQAKKFKPQYKALTDIDSLQSKDLEKCSVAGFPIENTFQKTIVFFDKEAENSSSISVQNSDLLQKDLQEPLDLQDLNDVNNEINIKDNCLTPTRDNNINNVQSRKTEGVQNEENIKGLLSYTSTKIDIYDDVLGNSNSPEFYFIDSQKESEKSLENLKKQKCLNDGSYNSNLEGQILNCVEPVCFSGSLLNNTILQLEEQYMQPSKSDIKVNTEDHSETDVFCTNSVDLLSKKECENCETCHMNNSTENDVNNKISNKIGISESLKNYKTKLDDTNPNSIVLKLEPELIPTDARRLDIYKEKSTINSEYDTSIINVKISHHRQGSNASVHSLGYTERCREIRGEAVEGSFNPETSLTAEDTESNMQVVYYEDQSLHKDSISSRDNCKLYPVSPFPAPQMQSIYFQRSISFSEASFSAFDDRIEEEVLFDEIGEYDKIDVHTDLIESVESIADIEDNLDLSILDLSSGEIKAGGISIKKKRRSKNKSSFPNSPCGSDMEGRPLHSPKAFSEVVNERLRYLADSWAEVEGPACGQLQGISCSATLLWSVDQHDHIFYTPSKVRSGMQEYVWKKLDGRAIQVACNQHGSVVWCVDRQRVAYYRTSVRENNPQGNSWEPFEKNIHCIAVDEDCVWAIKTNGDVFVRTGVTSWKPSGSGWITVKVASDLVQITCINGLVWALDIYNHIQIFKGELENACLQEDNQHSDWCELPGINATHVMLGAKNVCWVIDCEHGVWFNEDITKENPLGGTWYQLSLGEHQSVEATRFSSMLSYFRKGNEPKMIIANDIAGVIILGKQGTLHIAHGHLLGTRWELTIPSHMSESSCWTCVTAGGADMNRGFIWAMQPNGLLFCYKPHGQSYNVHPPAKVVLKYCSAGPRSLWALTAGPDVYVRIGISDTCPQGLKWLKVNMIGLENKRLNSICCGNLVVWSVDLEGNVWFQIIRSEDRSVKGYSPAWISVEGCPLDGSKLVNIVVGPDDRIVWACDDMNNVYTRKDVSENFWIGTSWELVSETSCKDLAISKNHVWGLCPNGDVLCRFGVSHSNVMGDYWKKVPGNFEQISVSANDELWGIDRQGHLYQRQTMLFYGSNLSSRAPSYNDLFSDHNDWELI